MRGVFITATGTDVGKTEVACRLVAQLRARGFEVAPRKPVVSGFTAAELERSDPGRLMEAAGLGPEALDVVAPHRFAAPLAPGPAAAREGRSFRAEDFVAAARFGSGFGVVEGVGGLMVPLDADHTVLDIVPKLGLPVLLVAGTYLGTLSHTLTAWVALRSLWDGPAAVVLSESEVSAMPPAETADELARFIGHRPLIVGRAPETGSELAGWVLSVG